MAFSNARGCNSSINEPDPNFLFTGPSVLLLPPKESSISYETIAPSNVLLS